MADTEMSEDDFRAVSGLAKVPDVSHLPKTPMPIVYEQACKAIAACTAIDEAKYWSDKADALAAWARIYNEDKVSIEAKRLKLHAYRRMAEIADAIMPQWRAERGFRVASVPIILKDYGIGRSQARVIEKIGEMPAAVVQRAIERRRPPTPSTLALVDNTPNPKWTRIKRTMSSLDSMTDDVTAEELAERIPEAEREKAYQLADDLSGWCYTLVEALDALDSKKKRVSNG